MSNFKIVCVDDQREILAALKKDLSGLEQFFQIDYCESTDEAKDVLDHCDADGMYAVLIICDHVMPGQNGIEFLSEIKRDDRFAAIPSVLLTGLATHQDTINAINDASIQAYVEKPWNKDELLEHVKKQYTLSVVKSGMDYQHMMSVLDQEVVLKALRMQT